MAVERVYLTESVVRLKTALGDWITEYTSNARVTIHCLPESHIHFALPRLFQSSLQPFNSSEAEKVTTHLLSFPILQRWVGVSYHPDTEFDSHCGEVLLGKCYDTVVFIDETQALNTNYETVAISVASTASQQAVARLMKEFKMIKKEPSENLHAYPLEDNILEWHFVITGSQVLVPRV